MTKEITCLKGEVILVDDEDYPVLSRHKWRYRHSMRDMHYAATHCFEARGFNDLRMAGMGAQIPRMLLQLETAMERAR